VQLPRGLFSSARTRPPSRPTDGNILRWCCRCFLWRVFWCSVRSTGTRRSPVNTVDSDISGGRSISNVARAYDVEGIGNATLRSDGRFSDRVRSKRSAARERVSNSKVWSFSTAKDIYFWTRRPRFGGFFFFGQIWSSCRWPQENYFFSTDFGWVYI